MNKFIENIFKLITLMVIWVITSNYLSLNDFTVISFFLCFFSIIIPLGWISNSIKEQKKGTNFPFFWRNLK